MKLVIVIIALVVGYLFYPFRDLYIREDPFDPQYHLHSTDFWTAGACAETAAALDAVAFRCPKRTLWSRIFRTYTEYNPSIREKQKEQGIGLGREQLNP